MARRVLNGIDVFNFDELKKFKIGVVTNYSSVNRQFKLLIDELFERQIQVKAIYVPEHGLYGQADGDNVQDSLHPKYHIPVVSLYGLRDTLECRFVDNVDVLLYDIQDVGLRYYTFIYTLAQVLKIASECGKKVIVLDRINPLGRWVLGTRIPKSLDSIVGAFELPIRYGLTTGELAFYYKKYLKLDVDLQIVKCEGWNGEMHCETDLFWNIPSPNLPTFSSLLCYAGMCLFEAANVSVGRGTTKPFEFLGAPWVDSDDLFESLKMRFPNLKFRKRDFIPQYREYTGKVCHGIEFFPSVNDNFFEVAIWLFDYFEKYNEFSINDERADKLSGIVNFRKNKEELLKANYDEYLNFVDDILLYGKLKVIHV